MASTPNFWATESAATERNVMAASMRFRDVWAATPGYQTALKNVASAPNDQVFMNDSLNAWMWQNHPLKAYIKFDIGGHPIYVTTTQALIGGSASAFLVWFLLLK